MSREWARAARSSVGSRRRPRRPWAARTRLTSVMTARSRAVGLAAAAGAATKTQQTAMKPARTCLAEGMAREGSGGPGRRQAERALAGRLGEHDSGEDERAARELGAPELLSEPQPRDDRRRDRLEHRRDPRSRRRDESE